MNELEVITVNDKEYVIIKEVQHNDTTFLYLSNLVDENDTLIRKRDKKNDVFPLESEEEFELACNLLLKHLMI